MATPSRFQPVAESLHIADDLSLSLCQGLLHFAEILRVYLETP